MDRAGTRTQDSGGTPWKPPFEAIVTAAACHHPLGMPYRLLGDLLGAHESTIILAPPRITPVLAQHGITPAAPGTRITTKARLREHATASGITISGITGQAPHKDRSRDDTPETANL